MRSKMNKISNTLSSVSSNDAQCTLMIIHNIFKISWHAIPCETKLLDKDAIFCMDRPEGYHEPSYFLPDNKNDAHKISQNVAFDSKRTYEGVLSIYRYLYHCRDGTYISIYFISDGFANCYDGSDEIMHWDFTPLSAPVDLCYTVANLNTTFFKQICPDLKVSNRILGHDC